jgi:hypothetical protein
MASPRLAMMAGVFALLATTSGGCPLAENLPGDLATPTDLIPSGGAEENDGGASPEQATTLEDVVSGIMEGDGGEELAWSYGSDWVYTGPGYNPQRGGSGGAPDGGANEPSAPGGSGGSGDGGSGLTFPPGSATYSGTVDCFRHESLEGYGELSEDLTFQVTMSFDDEGLPANIPFPLFIERIIVYADVCHVGDTETFTVPSTPTTAWTVTVTVVSATYTPQSASVVLEIDTGWVGEYSSITASGLHTLEAEVIGDALRYSADTHYEAEFRADDDWEGQGTEDFDCTGTLPRQ